MGAEEAPDRDSGGFDAVALAEVGAFLPAVTRAGRRIVEEKEKLVEEGDGLAVGVFGVLQPVKQRGDARYSLSRGRRQGFVELGESLRIGSIHTAAILGRLPETR